MMWRFAISRPWWTTLGLCLLLDVGFITFLRAPSVELNAGVYIWGLVQSLIFFYWVSIAYRLSARWLQLVIAVVMAAATVVTVGINFFVYREFGQYITRSMLHFIGADSAYIRDYLVTYMINFNAVLALGAGIALFYVWRPVKVPAYARTFQKGSKNVGWKIFLLLFLPLLHEVSLNSINQFTKEMLIPMPAATLSAVLEVRKLTAHRPLHYAADRLPVTPRSTEAAPPNVLIILNESWGKQQGMPVYGSKVNAMPQLQRWISRDPQHLLVWHTGFTSSTASDVSIPSIVTGVRPDESARQLHTMPLFWQWGKAAGAFTFYLTSERTTFAHFDQFFKCPQKDITVGAENIDTPIVNDLGIDDIVAARQLKHILSKKPANTPFVGLYYSNALHGPYQDKSQELSFIPAFDNRYDKALYIVDHAMAALVDTLKQQKLLDNTIIIFTGDHGGRMTPEHSAARIFSYYDEYFNIPMMMYVPEKWKAAHPEQYGALQKNLSQNISNLDIMPTVVDILGLTKANPAIVKQFKGQSLLKPVPTDRVLVGLGPNDTRAWDQEGLGLVMGTHRFVYNNVDGPQYFDSSKDPFERQNLWPDLAKRDRANVETILKTSYHLNRICRFTDTTPAKNIAKTGDAK